MAGTVLVIEDNKVSVQLFRMLLQRAGYEVTVVETAREGLEMARSLNPRLVIMDLTLPGDMDGVAATRELKSAAETADIPVLVITAHGGLDDVREAAEAAGCDGFLTKPVMVNHFMEAVARHARA